MGTERVCALLDWVRHHKESLEKWIQEGGSMESVRREAERVLGFDVGYASLESVFHYEGIETAKKPKGAAEKERIAALEQRLAEATEKLERLESLSQKQAVYG
jgi:hypothetical protein